MLTLTNGMTFKYFLGCFVFLCLGQAQGQNIPQGQSDFSFELNQYSLKANFSASIKWQKPVLKSSSVQMVYVDLSADDVERGPECLRRVAYDFGEMTFKMNEVNEKKKPLILNVYQNLAYDEKNCLSYEASTENFSAKNLDVGDFMIDLDFTFQGAKSSMNVIPFVDGKISIANGKVTDFKLKLLELKNTLYTLNPNSGKFEYQKYYYVPMLEN